MGYLFIVVVIYFVVLFYAASEFENIAKMKGHSGYFLWCLLGGIIGWLMVVALPDRNGDTISTAAQSKDSIPKNSIPAESNRLPEL